MICNRQKHIIFVSSAVRMLAFEGVDCKIPHRLEREIKHSCGNLSLVVCFKCHEEAGLRGGGL